MLILFRRHEKGCNYTSRDERRCRCGIWLDWHVAGKRYRKPLGLRDWQVAQQRARELEANGFIEDRLAPTIEEASEQYLADAQARQLRESTLYKYRLLLKQLKAFAELHGLVFISDFDLERTSRFRESWNNRGMAARKKLEALRTFFGFCADRGWIKANHAKKMKLPKIVDPPVLPFSSEQMATILEAIKIYPDKNNAIRLNALVLLLRYSGLRLTDAVTISREKIKNGRLILRTAKTGTVVYVPLPPFVIEAVADCPGKEYPFWSGESKPKTVLNVWEQCFRKLFDLAGIPDGHAHRFRHTFAVELLLAGIPIERVSALLGHESVKTTIQHYSAWSLARQQQLEEDVKKTWKLPATVTLTSHRKS